MAPNGTPGPVPPQQPGQGEEEQSPLQRFGRDLTDMAELGKLDPVIGRDEEIRRVMQLEIGLTSMSKEREVGRA
jgi:ATP-dependent Clp protease ATP-binding subunit ClpA